MKEFLLSHDAKYLRAIVDSLPIPLLIINPDLRILDANFAALEFLGQEREVIFNRLCGDLLQCVHALNSEEGCGSTNNCPLCNTRKTVEEISSGKKSFGRLSRMLLKRNGVNRHFYLRLNGAFLELNKQKLVVLTLEDLTKVIETQKMILVCSFCGKACDDKRTWHDLEKYIESHTEIEFSHGVCPECAKKHYPDIDLSDLEING